jgi:predicted phosphate transport protein (TIGR00153 family)
MLSIVPQNRAFFDLFEKAAGIIVQAAETYAELVRDYARREEHVARIRQFEHDGDEIAHRAYDTLDRSFITPFDREDIETLMRRMDDVVDEIDAAAKRLTLYRIAEPTPALVKQTDVLVKSCRLVRQAVGRLRNVRKPGNLHDELVEIHYLENVGDDINHAAIAELFDSASDPLYVMKWKEIHELTERAIDRCEDIANTIRCIVLKHA